jgi:hypothetical protein
MRVWPSATLNMTRNLFGISLTGKVEWVKLKKFAIR